MVSFRLGLATRRFIIACLRLELCISPVSDSSSNPFIKGRTVMSPLGWQLWLLPIVSYVPRFATKFECSWKTFKSKPTSTSGFFVCLLPPFGIPLLSREWWQKLKLEPKNHTTKINKQINWKINRIRQLWLPKNQLKKSKHVTLKNIDFFNINDKKQYQ